MIAVNSPVYGASAPPFQEQTANENRSPFATYAPRLRALGYAVLPIQPKGKKPATYAGSNATDEDVSRYGTATEIGGPRFFGLKDWAARAAEGISDAVFASWCRMPGNPGIGVATGAASGGLVALDLDVAPDHPRHEEALAVINALPGLNVSKVGRKGLTRFFRYRPDAPVADRKRLAGGALDVLSDGSQTVLPPSIHAATGRPYYWVEDSLDQHEIENLPVISEAEIDAVVAALAALGFDDATTTTDDDGEGSAASRNWLSGFALADLDSWVPHLGLANLERKRNGKGYVATAHWRAGGTGRPLSERKRNLDLHPVKGIRDFGDGRSYSPVGLVAAALDLDHAAAADWLFDRLRDQINAALPPWSPRPRVEARPVEPAQYVDDEHAAMWPSALDLQAERALAAADEPVEPVDLDALADPDQPEDEPQAAVEAVALVGVPDLAELYGEPSHAARMAEIEAQSHAVADEPIAPVDLGVVTLAEGEARLADYFAETIEADIAAQIERNAEAERLEDTHATLMDNIKGATRWTARALADVMGEPDIERRRELVEAYMLALRQLNSLKREAADVELKLAEMQHESQLHIIGGPTGIGKTRHAIAALRKHGGVALAATVAEAHRLKDEIGDEAEVLPGFDAVDNDGNYLCQRHDEGLELVRVGGTPQAMCGTCDYKDTCPLRAQIDRAHGAKVLVATHAKALSPVPADVMRGKPVLFVDETLEAVFADAVTISAEDLKSMAAGPLADYASTIEAIGTFLAVEVAEGREAAFELAHREQHVEADSATMGVRRWGFMGFMMQRRADLVALSKEAHATIDAVTLKAIKAKEIEAGPLADLKPFKVAAEVADALLSIAADRGTSKGLHGRVAFHVKKLADKEITKLVLRPMSRLHGSWVAGKVIVNADSTPAPNVADRFKFSSRFRQTVRPRPQYTPTFRVQSAEGNGVTQVTGAPTSKNRLMIDGDGNLRSRKNRNKEYTTTAGSRNRRRMGEVIRKIAADHAPGKVLVVATRAHHKMLGEALGTLPEHVSTATWEHAIGSNQWESFAALVTIGTGTNLRPEDMRAYIGQRTGIEPEMGADGQRLYLMGDADEHRRHREERAQVQAWGRLRLLRGKGYPQRVYALTDQMPQGYRADEVIAWDTMSASAQGDADVERFNTLLDRLTDGEIGAIPRRWAVAKAAGLTEGFTEKAWGEIWQGQAPEAPLGIYLQGPKSPSPTISPVGFRLASNQPFDRMLISGDATEAANWLSAKIGQSVEIEASLTSLLSSHAVVLTSRRALVNHFGLTNGQAGGMDKGAPANTCPVRVFTADGGRPLEGIARIGVTEAEALAQLRALGVEAARVEGLQPTPIETAAPAAPSSSGGRSLVEVEPKVIEQPEARMGEVEPLTADPLVAAFADLLRDADPASRERHLAALPAPTRALIQAALAGSG